MKMINRYILNEAKMPIFFGISLFTFIFLIEIIVSMLESIIVKGISIIDVSRMISFYLPMILSQTIPMGIFLGVMVTFGNLTKYSEITAINSIGISLKKLLKLMSLVGVIGTIFIFFLQESIIPRSYVKLQQLSIKMVYNNPVFQLKDKVLIDEVDKYKIYIDEIDPKTKDAKNVLIFFKENTKYPTLITGARTYWENAAMILEDSKFYRFKENGEEQLRGKFKEKKIPLTNYFRDVEIKMKDIEGMGVATLYNEYKSSDKEDKLPYLVEINRKIAVPISAIILSILGVLLSVGNKRSGKGTNYGVAIGIIFIYIVFLNLGMVFAYRGIISPFIGVWFSNIFLIILTYSLYRKKGKVI
ncbi:MAG: LptF/LptG family permease [Fusobacterium sp. JB021]|nr:LptF/LptG family permease [Fusobacterium sp. JB021]MDP0507664.1 LptF/LptG family permease [Fusobacterium sp. JB019]